MSEQDKEIEIRVPDWLLRARPYIAAVLMLILFCMSTWYLMYGMERAAPVDELTLDDHFGTLELDGPSVMRQACGSSHPALVATCDDTFAYIYKAAIIISLAAVMEALCSFFAGRSKWIDLLRDCAREVVIVGAVMLSTVLLYVLRWWA